MFVFQRFRGHAKSSVISTLSLAVTFFAIIFAVSFISNLSLCSSAFRSKGDSEAQHHGMTRLQLKPTSTEKPLLIMAERVHNQGEGRTDDHFLKRSTEPKISETYELLSPKVEALEEESLISPRLAIAESDKLSTPKLAILEQDRLLSPKFERRARDFFRQRCEFQFFMTWISPVESFGRRELFALESLFKSHPRGCLMILSRTMDSRAGRLMLKPLADRGFRVLAVTANLPFLFKNTPAVTWLEDMNSGKRGPGEIPLAQNLSNLLRLAVLYKYGGIYVDTDFIILKAFTNLRNSIAAQSIDQSGNWTRLNNAVLIFDKNHPLLYRFIKEFALTFDGNKWGHNGPYLVSRVIEREGGKQKEQMAYNLTVLPPITFYPVDWTRVASYFAKPHNRNLSKWVEAKLRQLHGEAYGVHLWNRESSKLKIEEGSIIGRLLTTHCIICRDVYKS